MILMKWLDRKSGLRKWKAGTRSTSGAGYSIALLTGPLSTRGESAAARRRVLAITGTDGAHYRLLRPCEQLFTRITCPLFTLGEMLRVTRTRSRQVIGCTEKTTDQSALPARNVKVTIWFKSVYKDILVG